MTVPNSWYRVVRRSAVCGCALPIAAVIIAEAACARTNRPADSGVVSHHQPVLRIRDCPHTWTIPDKDKPTDSVPIVMSVAPTTTNVPEYHDCQRLIENGHYGPLVAVFAWDSLELLADSVAKLKGKAERAIAAAEIWNVDSTTYTPLDLRPGFTCLYMYKDSTDWKAKLVWKDWPEPECNTLVDPNAVAGMSLEVSPLQTPDSDFTVADVVPAARWEWDPTNQRHYIGLKCEPTRWCEVGLPTLATSPQYTWNLQQPKPPIEVRHSLEIKGWYDEQRLAIRNGATLAPSIVGTVLPVPGLKTRHLSDYTHQWAKVASVALSDSSPYYLEKFNFVPPMGPDSTTVWMCRGNQTDCPGVPVAATCAPSKDDTVPWWAMLKAKNQPTKYKCVEYWVNPKRAQAPGSVRWRFIDKDETVWVTCPTGCCQIRPGS